MRTPRAQVPAMDPSGIHSGTATVALRPRNADLDSRLDPDQLLRALRGHTIGVMVYGSYARQTATVQSDIDLLQLVPHSPRSYAVGPINVTAYLPVHLKLMAFRGSLFVRHLITEGVLLKDDQSVLRRILDAYRPPSEYSSHLAEIGAAARALHLPQHQLEGHSQALARLGIYLVRTAAYIRCLDRGSITFDLEEVCRLLPVPGLDHVFAMRSRLDCLTLADLAVIRQCVDLLVPDQPVFAAKSVEGLAISLSSDFPRASGLIAAVMAGDGPIDYAAEPSILF